MEFAVSRLSVFPVKSVTFPKKMSDLTIDTGVAVFCFGISYCYEFLNCIF